MRKVLLKDLAEFREWQRTAVKGVCEVGARSVNVMAPPCQYPVILVWSFVESRDEEATFPNALFDKFDHKFIYLGDFPVRNIKRGQYVYQVFQTGDTADDV